MGLLWHVHMYYYKCIVDVVYRAEDRGHQFRKHCQQKLRLLEWQIDGVHTVPIRC